jgi:hypothetical protein
VVPGVCTSTTFRTPPDAGSKGCPPLSTSTEPRWIDFTYVPRIESGIPMPGKYNQDRNPFKENVPLVAATHEASEPRVRSLVVVKPGYRLKSTVARLSAATFTVVREKSQSPVGFCTVQCHPPFEG